MKFAELTKGIDGRRSAIADPVVNGLSIDSRTLLPGDVFICMPGHRHDSHAFIAQAAAKGAIGVVAHTAGGAEESIRLGLPVLLVRPEDVATVSALLARRTYGDALASLQIVGITGTNGKTTTAWILTQALQQLGHSAGYLGTLGTYVDHVWTPGENTTPNAVPLAREMATWSERGVEYAVMEVSSHALAEQRVDALSFSAVVFTNLTQDHLDYHGTMEAYREAKHRLFFDRALHRDDARFVLNVCDPVGREWADALPGAVRYGCCPLADRRCEIVEATASGLIIELEGIRLSSRLAGRFNAENLGAAYATLVALGVEPSRAVDVLAQVEPARGRFESIPNERGFGVIVDYAHTPDAISSLLTAARDLQPQRVVIVVGCGGDRDRTKRPLMAQAAVAGADLAIFTSDNPRSEDPDRILDDMDAGLADHSRRLRIVDRRQAIYRAIELAAPGDVVLIAGKGHESVQVVGDHATPFDDAEVAREALQSGSVP
ncbi:MAG: UDP-N-acetylmuramoyl-L-alanyl-D-glutamate--2,6-diaminopimelate ligase [Fimbriimonadaceae bacterium]